MARYERLTQRLAGDETAVITLSFRELDRIVDGGLPPSARKHAAWWANSRTAHSHAAAWLDAGRRASPDFNGGRVRFTVGAEAVRPPRAQRSTAGATAALVATGESVRHTVEFDWLDAGAYGLSSGRPLAPGLPAIAGVYRLTFADRPGAAQSFYFGETDNLARRLGTNYRSPGPSQKTSVRIQERVIATCASGGTVSIAVVTSVLVDGQMADLTVKAARLLAESAAILDARTTGLILENR